MKFITGQDRSQTTLFPISLDQAIDTDNEVRLIDIFVDSLPLEKFGFDKKKLPVCIAIFHTFFKCYNYKKKIN